MLFASLPGYGSAAFRLNPSAEKWPESVGNGLNQLELVCISISIAIGIAIGIVWKRSEIVGIWQTWLHRISTKSFWSALFGNSQNSVRIDPHCQRNWLEFGGSHL